MDEPERVNFTRPARRPPGRKCPRIKKVEPHQVVTGFVCCVEPYDVYTHWNPNEGRSEACINGKELCPACLAKMPIRYKAYIHCYSEAQDEEFFVELTALAMEKLEKILGGWETLRGTQLEFRREYNVKKSTIITRVIGRWVKKQELPKPKTPEITLGALFGV